MERDKRYKIRIRIFFPCMFVFWAMEQVKWKKDVDTHDYPWCTWSFGGKINKYILALGRKERKDLAGGSLQNPWQPCCLEKAGLWPGCLLSCSMLCTQVFAKCSRVFCADLQCGGQALGLGVLVCASCPALDGWLLLQLRGC